MDDPWVAELAAALDALGLEHDPETISHVRRREHSTVWTATVFGSGQPVRAVLYVYDLSADPAAIVDAEEERSALVDLRSTEAPDFVPVLIGDLLHPHYVVLVTTSAEEAPLFEPGWEQSAS